MDDEVVEIHKCERKNIRGCIYNKNTKFLTLIDAFSKHAQAIMITAGNAVDVAKGLIKY